MKTDNFKQLINKFSESKRVKPVLIYGWLVVLSFVRAVSTYTFVVPNAFAPGGVGGLSSIIYNIALEYNEHIAETWLNPAVTILIFNIPLLILAFKTVNLKFAVNSLFVVLCYAGFMALFSLVGFPQFRARDMDSSVMLLAAAAGGVSAGACLGLMLRVNASAGGTDIIAKAVFTHRPDINIAWLIFIFDSIVVFLSGIIGFIESRGEEDTSIVFLMVLTPIFYSFISMFVAAKVGEVITTGFESSVVFHIITDKATDVADAIIEYTKRGATIQNAEGEYTHNQHSIVISVMRKKQISTARKIIHTADPDAFMWISNTREVNGKGFTRPL